MIPRVCTGDVVGTLDRLWYVVHRALAYLQTTQLVRPEYVRVTYGYPWGIHPGGPRRNGRVPYPSGQSSSASIRVRLTSAYSPAARRWNHGEQLKHTSLDPKILHLDSCI